LGMLVFKKGKGGFLCGLEKKKKRSSKKWGGRRRNWETKRGGSIHVEERRKTPFRLL